MTPKPSIRFGCPTPPGFRCAQTSAPGGVKRNLCYPSAGSVFAASPACDAVPFSG
jgi:hypothetical protein